MNKTLNERLKAQGVEVLVEQEQAFMNHAWRRKKGKALLRAKKKKIWDIQQAK